MSPHSRLLFGPLAAVVLGVGIILLPRLLPAYDPITQTVSEIGEVGSPARIPFALMLCCVAGCVLMFASALRSVSTRLNRSAAAAYLTGAMAVSAAGVGAFAYPHPLHNVFGLSELIGYQAPLVLALTWRREKRAAEVVSFSWLMAALVWCAIIANLSTLDREGSLWHHEAAFYGVVQRSLFAAWFVWLAGAGLILRGVWNVGRSPSLSS
jgi:hypothetical membrane protein